MISEGKNNGDSHDDNNDIAMMTIIIAAVTLIKSNFNANGYDGIFVILLTLVLYYYYNA